MVRFYVVFLQASDRNSAGKCADRNGKIIIKINVIIFIFFDGVFVVAFQRFIKKIENNFFLFFRNVLECTRRKFFNSNAVGLFHQRNELSFSFCNMGIKSPAA